MAEQDAPGEAAPKKAEKKPPEKPPTSGRIEKEITFTAGGETIHGLLTHPDAALVENRGATPQQRKGGLRAWAILCHGWLSSRLEMGALPNALADAGIGVLAFDWRGHGKSEGPRGFITVERASEDLDAARAYLRDYEWADVERTAYIGHSMGAAMILAYSPHIWPHDCVVASAVPATILEETSLPARWGYGLLWNLKGRRNGNATVRYPIGYKDLFVSKDAAARAQAIGYLQKRAPLAIYPHLRTFNAEAWAYKCRAPALYLISKRDKVVSPSASHRVARAHSGPKRVEELRGVGHSMFMDAAAPNVIETVKTYVAKRLSAYPEIRG